ncbi:hypothetical protein [Vitreimonas flagellata]|uniref:hypothetical protein n=1 Tax=Vitreimonas flagellata TaxID=2560861 RepID=UPI001074D589|nr:hypothetical protein [Vitreimonas flagellata]
MLQMELNGERPYVLPDKSVCFFHEEPSENKKWSEENGRPIYDRVIVVTIKAPGQKNSEASYELARIFPDDGEIDEKTQQPKKSRKVRENVLQRAGIAEAFKAYMEKQELAASGTPLETWPILNVVQVKSLKHVNVYTVEQLAELPDGALPNTGLGMNAREIRKKAQAYLTQAADTASVTKLAGQLERIEQRLKELNEENAQLRRENAELKQGSPAAVVRKPAPPPKPEKKQTAAASRATSKPFAAPKAKRPVDEDRDIESDVQASRGDAEHDGVDEDPDFIE